MLVTFSCPAYADVTMFGDVALRMLKMMGHSDTVPGALLAEDVKDALARLETALAAQRASPEPEIETDWEDEEPEVSIAHRATPLVELLHAAVREECNVMWEDTANAH